MRGTPRLPVRPLSAPAPEDNSPIRSVYGVPALLSSAHLTGRDAYQRMYRRSVDTPGEFWAQQARASLTWMRDFARVQAGSFDKGDVTWFLDGQLNVSYNCIDRHLATSANKVAILWEGDEPTDVRRITYAELHAEVCRLANVLLAEGVRKGDRVAIYMPMVPEAAFAMLACARIGAVHTVVFAGFSAESLRDRVNDASCRVVITADAGLRGSRHIPLKRLVDEALMGCPSVKRVLVHRHTNDRVPFHPERDVWLNEAMEKQRPYCPPEPMHAEDVLFMLYTSGSTGKPKGIVHTSAGYLLYAATTHRYVFDYKDDDVYACMADIGWITGHSYIVYGPLCNGATTVMFESLPTYPNASRYWDMVDRHKISLLYTAPTAIRSLMALGDSHVAPYNLSSLRVLGSVGEPINPEAWNWFYHTVGRRRCAIVDTYWQTETGGHVITTLPGCHAMKPGAAGPPAFGIDAVLLDAATGKEISGPGEGVLAIKQPWPGIARTIFNDHKRFVQTYLGVYPGYYFTGDGARRDEDGYYQITGRVDDVINKAGHRLGTAEIESALVAHPACAEAAVVAIAHPIKGQAIVAFCALRAGFAETPELGQELRDEVRRHIGPIAAPDAVVITELPKTRSGKIMRRLLRKLVSGDTDLGDTTTLSNPDAVEKLAEKTDRVRKSIQQH